MRVLGCTKRDAGTLKPSGSRGLETSSPGPDPLCATEPLLLVSVVTFAVIRATTFDGLRPELPFATLDRLSTPFHVKHGSQTIR
jgi:hypothetical protein